MTRAPLKCEICGTELWVSVQGAYCPNGHGRLKNAKGLKVNVVHTDEIMECPADEIMDCPECEGKGWNDCDCCGGSGVTECGECGQDVDCLDCDGEGAIECSHCNGTGEVACNGQLLEAKP